jgi:hypothetical protein
LRGTTVKGNGIAIHVRHTNPKAPRGGVVAYSDGNDDAQVYISPKGLTRITVSQSVHASPVQMLAWITALTNAAEEEWRSLRDKLAKP